MNIQKNKMKIKSRNYNNKKRMDIQLINKQ